MNDLACLDARSFHAHLGDLLRAEFVAQGAFLVALAEFDRRGSYRDLGYASLFDYLHRGLKLSRGAAHYRRSAAWLVGRFPEVLEPIQDGRLCFTTASILATVLTEENRAEVLPRFHGLSKQEALEVAAELKPRKVVPERMVVTKMERAAASERDDATGRTEAAERVDLVEPAASWTDARQKVHLGELDAPRPVVVPMTATESRLHITVSREFLALLKKAKVGESHRNPGASDEQVLKLALEALVEKQSKRKACVPARVKREVVQRDEGKCQWKLADGGICGSTLELEIDHVVPRGKGGSDTIDNCRILCRGHNLEAARQTYGDEVMDLFTRGGVNARRATVGEAVAEYGSVPGDGRRRNPIARPRGGGVGCGPCSGRKPPRSARSGFASPCFSSSVPASSSSTTRGRRSASRSAGAPGTTSVRCTWA